MSTPAELRARAEASAKALIEARSRSRALRDRTLPDFATATFRRRPSVYYLSPSESAPSGGVRVIYRHVDALNALGIPAAVLHDRRGFRSTWFDNTTTVMATRDVVLHPDDILVVPEFYGAGLHALPRGIRVLVFNQGAYHTFDHVDRAKTRPGAPYADLPGLLGILTVSADSERLLTYAFGDLPVFRARPVVDGTRFHPGPEVASTRIAFMQSRRAEERELLLHLLRARGIAAELVPIAGRREDEVAAILRSSSIFLSFSERDGFGLPPAEAMASGCYVIGYPGGGGDEFFDPAYCAPVSSTLEFAQAIEGAVGTPPGELRERGLLASARILEYYSAEGLRADLARTYGVLGAL